VAAALEGEDSPADVAEAGVGAAGASAGAATASEANGRVYFLLENAICGVFFRDIIKEVLNRYNQSIVDMGAYRNLNQAWAE
jgi:hypothetical protein